MKRENYTLNTSAEITEVEESVSFEDILKKAKTNQDRARPFFGVYSTVLFFDEEQQIFCIQHPFEQEYAIPVSKTTVAVSKEDAGREVLVSFEGGDILYPIVTGKIRNLPVVGEMDLSEESIIATDTGEQERLVFKAEKEIVLQCGKSSITLTRAGKVIIRGAYLLSRSSGVNKIKGGSVQLN